MLESTTRLIEILGIPVYGGDIPTVTEQISKGCADGNRNNYCVSATGAHGLVFAQQNPEFRETLKSFHLNLPDGMPGVWIGRMKGARAMRRCYGPDVFKSVMMRTAQMPVKHFFCGGQTGVADQLRDAVHRKFGNANVVGTFCPPFLNIDEYDYKSIAQQINDTGANILWIGLSTPKQELFARRIAPFTNVNYVITIGAAFDFHTDRLTQAPAFFQKLGLEWLFRLAMEPRRLYKRYLEVVPLFIYYNLRELFTFGPLKSLKTKT